MAGRFLPIIEDVRRTNAITFLALALVATTVGAQTPQPGVPQPFPSAGAPPVSGSSRPPQSAPPTTAAPQPQPAPPVVPAAPVPATAAAPPPPGGVAVYPTAEYLGTYDAGAGQQYVLYGVQLPYAEIVSYYKTVLKAGGREIFRAPMPPTHQFDLGRYNEDRMAFPPSVVVKDYTWNNSPGYLHVVGTTEKRYRTVVQIVAPGPTP